MQVEKNNRPVTVRSTNFGPYRFAKVLTADMRNPKVLNILLPEES